MAEPPRLSVVGLGYVGLPLSIMLARHYPVTGFDIDATRIAELEAGRDRTGEIEPAALAGSPLTYSAEAGAMAGSDIFIVTVPTPVDDENKPDLRPLLGACDIVGSVLARGAIVVFESTVYPGVTEEVCAPALERTSGLVCGRDFFLGYSPERVNPGDRDHTIDKITKVVAGQTPEVTVRLKELYGAITGGDVFVARDIKTAEAAKVIENAQRDINIAFVNEVAMILQNYGLSVHDVLEAAATKWNFLPFTPGLVGGHCIGVDPYYLAHGAQTMGHEPAVVLAGRRINDGMGAYIAERIAALLPAPTSILVLGLTFKENVPDLRNSKVVDVIAGLRARGHEVDVHDPIADGREAAMLYGLDLKTELDSLGPYGCLVGAVAHAPYRALTPERLRSLVAPGGLIADIKGLWRGHDRSDRLRYWTL